MTQLAEEKGVHVRNFAALEKATAGDVLPWLDERRKAGIARFDLVGFPSATDEEWRHTQLQPIVKTKFALPAADGAARATGAYEEYGFGKDAVSEIVFVN